MIKNISTTTSQWVTTTQPYPTYINPSAVSSGSLRYNPQLNRMEVYDGSTWMEFGTSVNVDLTYRAQRILEWGQNKMREEEEYEQLAKTSPAVAEALNAKKHAEAQLRIVTALVKDHV